MDSLLYFYRQNYRTMFATTECRHAAPSLWIRSFLGAFLKHQTDEQPPIPSSPANEDRDSQLRNETSDQLNT